MKKFLNIFKSATSRVGFLLIVLLILPMLIYSTYQLIQRSQDEQMIRDIYNRQLDVILFSVNQFAWSQYQSWRDLFFENVSKQKDPINVEMLTDNLVRKYPSLIGSFIKYNESQPQFSFSPYKENHSKQEKENFLFQILAEYQETIDQNNQNKETDYWRPIIVHWELIKSENICLMIFPLPSDHSDSPKGIGGIYLNTENFINIEINQQLQSILSENTNLMMGIFHKNKNEAIFSTADDLSLPFDRTEPIWLLPDHEIVIKTEGLSLSALASKRMRINLFFLIAVNLLVISGIVVFLYNMNQQIRLAQMKTDFVANVSHELRTPLSLIRMYAETLEMGRVKDASQINAYYNTIIYESQRLTQLINNILDFSRIESKRKKYQFSLQRIHPIIEEVIEMYDYQFKKMNVNVQMNLTDNPPNLYLDKDAVIQVFINLIDNAIKFSPEEKIIQIDLYNKNKEIEISIRDHGIGIPYSEQKVIFNKFYRVGSTLVHDTKGSGLGLTLVKYIMEIHKGRVTVESRMHEGSCFKLFFPIPAYLEESN